jgi:hypothetical protein
MAGMLLEYDFTVGSNTFKMIEDSTGNLYVGDQTKKTCNIMPEKWVNPDPASFKALIGKC